MKVQARIQLFSLGEGVQAGDLRKALRPPVDSERSPGSSWILTFSQIVDYIEISTKMTANDY
jgi:hypothetical protein